MSILNLDVLYLIFKELQDCGPALYSCLLVNKTWCEMIIPILWKNPWKLINKGKEQLFLNVIISHLSDESKDNLNNQGMKISYQRPLFDYISFCKHLNLKDVVNLIGYPDVPIFKKEMLKLFINSNAKFTHLYIPHEFYQLNLILKAKRCFSELKAFSYNNLEFLPFTSIHKLEMIDLIKNASRYLTEVEINNELYDDQMVIRSIYQNCPNLKYVKLIIKSNGFLELEKLLTNCQYLDTLGIYDNNCWININWKYLFKILANSSPTSLFKFKFIFYKPPKLEHLKLFFDNWKNRNPMHPIRLHVNCRNWNFGNFIELVDFVDKYKKTRIVKKLI
ncbi:hypothetical protein C1645_813608 [Glomus cerebriforme]|uniref:F-box domain-containing protein n=1 Tax=Glomus cerebriforme TaxID=658196 RepID=A0A397THK8_9GLOM|nr:hypothetical protein C1645_813608 [Glomus cerebriforme]